MLKVELHSHTSDDPRDRIPYSTRQLIDTAAARGFDALAVTLHDLQLDIEPLIPYAADRGIVLIPGIERTIEGKHVLLLNFRRGSEQVDTFEDLARLRQREPGLVVAPHPFFPTTTCVGRILRRNPQLFDAVEYNAMFTSSLNFNAEAERWARAQGKPLVGNGDVHRLEQLGSTYSLVDAERHPDAICAAIKAGAVQVSSTPLAWTRAAAIFTDMMATTIWSQFTRRPEPREPSRSFV